MRLHPAALFLLALLPATAAAQDPARPVMPMVELKRAPTVDGEVIEDPVWRNIAPGSGFIQKTPDQGQPASQRTEIRLAYTDEAIYVDDQAVLKARQEVGLALRERARKQNVGSAT